MEDLYQKYYDAVFRWCFQEVHFQACYIPLIEDCIHDAFRKAIVCYEEYKDYMNPMGWIAKAARNCFLSELRKQKNRSSQASLKKIVTEQAMSRDLYLSVFERWLEQEECKEKLDAILSILTDQERIILLIEPQGASHTNNITILLLERRAFRKKRTSFSQYRC